MTIEVKESLIHWNYYLALESDLAQVARYIEFNKNNFKTYSIELAHILLASSSEVDVIAKKICELIDPTIRANNIDQYKIIINENIRGFKNEKAFIPRFGLTFIPFSNWKLVKNPKNPLWWRSYNHVKHQRDNYFYEANLKNVINSLGGLLITTFYYYKTKMILDNPDLTTKEITRYLMPESELIKLDNSYYYENIFV